MVHIAQCVVGSYLTRWTPGKVIDVIGAAMQEQLARISFQRETPLQRRARELEGKCVAQLLTWQLELTTRAFHEWIHRGRITYNDAVLLLEDISACGVEPETVVEGHDVEGPPGGGRFPGSRVDAENFLRLPLDDTASDSIRPTLRLNDAVTRAVAPGEEKHIYAIDDIERNERRPDDPRLITSVPAPRLLKDRPERPCRDDDVFAAAMGTDPVPPIEIGSLRW